MNSIAAGRSRGLDELGLAALSSGRWKPWEHNAGSPCAALRVTDVARGLAHSGAGVPGDGPA
jgi:hypothetical protein